MFRSTELIDVQARLEELTDLRADAGSHWLSTAGFDEYTRLLAREVALLDR